MTTQTTQYTDVSSGTFNPFDRIQLEVINGGNSDTGSRGEIKSSVTYVIKEASPISKGAHLASDLIAEALAENPRFKQILADHGEEVARALYGDKQNLSSLRIGAGFTQVELAKEMNTSQSHVARIENGQVSPSVDTVCKIASVLKLSPEIIFKALIHA